MDTQRGSLALWGRWNGKDPSGRKDLPLARRNGLGPEGSGPKPGQRRSQENGMDAGCPKALLRRLPTPGGLPHLLQIKYLTDLNFLGLKAWVA